MPRASLNFLGALLDIIHGKCVSSVPPLSHNPVTKDTCSPDTVARSLKIETSGNWRTRWNRMTRPKKTKRKKKPTTTTSRTAADWFGEFQLWLTESSGWSCVPNRSRLVWSKWPWTDAPVPMPIFETGNLSVCWSWRANNNAEISIVLLNELPVAPLAHTSEKSNQNDGFPRRGTLSFGDLGNTSWLSFHNQLLNMVRIWLVQLASNPQWYQAKQKLCNWGDAVWVACA